MVLVVREPNVCVASRRPESAAVCGFGRSARHCARQQAAVAARGLEPLRPASDYRNRPSRPGASTRAAPAGFVPDCVLLFTRLAPDDRVPRRHKLILSGLVAYLALPFDLVPDFIPVAGHPPDDGERVGLRARLRHHRHRAAVLPHRGGEDSGLSGNLLRVLSAPQESRERPARLAALDEGDPCQQNSSAAVPSGHGSS